MQLTCPHCQAAWEFSDRRPAFCPFCGKSLHAEPPTEPFPSPAPTGSEAATLPPTARQPEADASDPKVIGGYRLLRVVGVGGMGKVYEAEDVTTRRRVALKLVSADYARSADAVERFRQEGRLASLIAHPRCVFVLAAEEEAGRPYIVMELMPGDTLDDLVRNWGPLVPSEAVSLILDVMEGLQEAHRLGVVHRDVKPSNCFFGVDGRLKIGDFGLSKSLAQVGHLTKTGSFLGTPLYASPEQVRGETLDAQTDVYSVAATLYYLLTGKAPFQSENAAITLARIAADPAPSMCTVKPELSPALDAVVLRGLERDRKRRWRTIEQFAAALRPFLPGRLSVAGLGVRFRAVLLDVGILSVVTWILALLLVFILGTDAVRPTNTRIIAVESAVGQVLGLAAYILYFGILEGLWGWSLGKLLLGLRVRNIATGLAPGVGRGLLRAMLFTGLSRLGPIVSGLIALLFGLSAPGDSEAMALGLVLASVAVLVGHVVGIGLMLSTMRTRNGYRGLHEFGSRTCVVPLARGNSLTSAWTVVVTPASQALSRPPSVPEKIGAFDIRGAFRWDDDARILLGFDAALGRQVVLWLRHRDEPTLRPARRELNRMARLRWLAAGPFSVFQWDAFVAPGGCPLPMLIEAHGRIDWPQFQPLLQQLTDELRLALKERTLPKGLEPSLVWVRPDGQVVLVDMPLTERAATAPANERRLAMRPDDAEEDQALELLARIALWSLEGCSPPEKLPRDVRAPLPLTAKADLRELLIFERTGLPLGVFQKRLTKLQEKPAVVTRARRACQLAVLAGLLVLSFGCFVPSYLSGLWGNADKGRTTYAVFSADAGIDDLDRASLSDFLCAGLNADVLPRLHVLGQLEADQQLRGDLEHAIDRLEEKDAERKRHAFLYEILWGGSEKTIRQQRSERRNSEIRSGYRLSAGMNLSAPGAADLRNSARGAMMQAVQEVAPREEDKETTELLYTLPWPAVWVVWAFLLPGGLSYLATGIALVRRDGKPATHLQSGWRALLIWVPLGVLLTASALSADWYWSHWGTAAAPSWLIWQSEGLWWSVWLLPVVYIILALRYPTRSPLDRLAGTYLVPR